MDYSFLELKKASKKDDFKNAKHRLILMGDCATQHLATAIQGYSFAAGGGCNLVEVIDTDYNLIDSQIIDDNSELYTSDAKFVLIFMCTQKLQLEFFNCKNKSGFADEVYNKIINYWNMIGSKKSINILQFTFLESDDRVFGNFALKTEESFLFQVKKLNYLLAQACQNYKNVFLIDLNSIQSIHGKMCDEKLYYIAKMPLSLDILPQVAKNVVDVINAISGKFKKCVICDLDNTLWGGVIGDDGINGIQIGELGNGRAFTNLQIWLKKLKERGIILAICSKNNEDTAKEPFLKHPEMVLKLDDISCFVANWEDKASNIKYIQKVLNIGMDSMVFLDDNPFERNLVKSMIPEIEVPELPEDPSLYLSYLQSLNLFETASFSEEDKKRTSQYQAEAKRVETERMFDNYDDYLKSLEMVATVSAFDEFQTPRISQLTQRSNQFNLRTVRYTEDDIKRIMASDEYIGRYFMLKDKFGDHGLISVVILKKLSDKTLFIENLLMSCRVLKRGMEEFIINSLIDAARQGGYTELIGEYIPTAKNAMVKDFYKNMGFSELSPNKYIAKVDEYKEQLTFIK